MALALVVFVLYLLNKKARVFYFLPYEFGRNHVNDLLAGILWLPYLNSVLYFSKSKKVFVKPLECAAIALVCGFIWEFVYPIFNRSSTSDLLDVLCYVVGSLIYSKITHNYFFKILHLD